MTQQRRDRVLSLTTSPGVPLKRGIELLSIPGIPACLILISVMSPLRRFALDEAVTNDPFSGLALDRDCDRCFFKSASVPVID